MHMTVVESPTITELTMGPRNIGSEKSCPYESSVMLVSDKSGTPAWSAVDGYTLYAIIHTNGARKMTITTMTRAPQVHAVRWCLRFRDNHDSRISFTSLPVKTTENKDPERCDDQDKNHNSDRHRSAVTTIEVAEVGQVGEEIDRRGPASRSARASGENVNCVEHLERPHRLHDQCEHQRPSDVRQGDPPERIPRIGTIDRSSAIKAPRNPLQRSEHQQTQKGEQLPRFCENEDVHRRCRI